MTLHLLNKQNNHPTKKFFPQKLTYLILSVRQWTCKNGHRLDRDENAAENIPSEGLRINNIVRNWRLHGWRLKLDFFRQAQVGEPRSLFVFSKWVVHFKMNTKKVILQIRRTTFCSNFGEFSSANSSTYFDRSCLSCVNYASTLCDEYASYFTATCSPATKRG